MHPRHLHVFVFQSRPLYPHSPLVKCHPRIQRMAGEDTQEAAPDVEARLKAASDSRRNERDERMAKMVADARQRAASQLRFLGQRGGRRRRDAGFHHLPTFIPDPRERKLKRTRLRSIIGRRRGRRAWGGTSTPAGSRR